MSENSFAQKGMSTIGGGWGAGFVGGEFTGNSTLAYQYNLTNNIRLEAAAFSMGKTEEYKNGNFTEYHDTGYNYMAGVSLQYLFGSVRPWRPFISAGVGYGDYTDDWSHTSGGNVAALLGTGMTYRFHSMSTSFELKTSLASEMSATYLLIMLTRFSDSGLNAK